MSGGRGRQLIGVLAAVVVSAVGLVALVAFFSGRDDATLERAVPGVAAPRLDGPQLRAGNVVLRYSDAADRPALQRLQDSVSGRPTPELVEAGQAVLVRGGAPEGVVAEALGRRLVVLSPDDPQLVAFVEHWLGRGAR